MVKLHVKCGNETQFLFETTVTEKSEEVIRTVTSIFNGRIKIERICGDIEELVKHGTYLPPNMLGLTDEQVEELKLIDTWGETCIPQGGFNVNDDPVGRRNGKQPLEKMQTLLTRTVGEVRAEISKKNVEENHCLRMADIQRQLEILRGACTIVYPMNLPPHDPIRLEFENKEELGGTQDSLRVIEPDLAELWFCGKQILPGKPLSDFVGKNEKSKLIVKIQRKGQGAPAREPIMTEEDQKQLMLLAYRKQEEAKVSTNILLY